MKLPYQVLHDLTDAQTNFEALQAQGLYTGRGAPAFQAQRGNYYFRTDTPSTANQRIYVCTGGSTWTGIV